MSSICFVPLKYNHDPIGVFVQRVNRNLTTEKVADALDLNSACPSSASSDELSVPFESVELTLGTAFPPEPFAFAVPVALGTRSVGSLFDKVTAVERWVRWVTGAAFIAAGIYFSLVYIFHVTG